MISATVRMNTTKFKFIKTKFEMDSNVLKMKKKPFHRKANKQFLNSTKLQRGFKFTVRFSTKFNFLQ